MQVLGTDPAPAFVLPDEAAKNAYLARALRLGRFRLASEFGLTLLLYGLAIWFNLSVAFQAEGGAAPWVTAALLALVLAALRQAEAMRGAGQLRAWLHRTGAEAPQGPERTEDGPKARRVWQAGLKRCRPGWMVAAEILGYCAFAASFVLFSLTSPAHCGRALWEWWRAEGPASVWQDGCFNIGAAMMCSVVAWGAVPRARPFGTGGAGTGGEQRCAVVAAASHRPGGGDAAVHDDFRPGDVPRFVGEQEQHRVRHVPAAAHAA